MTMITDQNLSNGILSVLPLIYVGWSDSVLSPTEITEIQTRISNLTHINDEDKKYLENCLDPLNPPDDSTFKFWGKQIKGAAENLNNDQKSSLVNLGLEIVKSGTQKKSGLDDIPKTKAALQDLRASLGLTAASEQLLFKKIFEKEEVAASDYEQPIFDPMKMKAILDGEESEVRDWVRKLLRDPHFLL